MRLVPDWKQCWRWNSMHAMGGAGTLIGAWEALPETMKADFPVKWVIALALVMLALGVIGRLRDQGKALPKPTVPQSNDFHQGPTP